MIPEQLDNKYYSEEEEKIKKIYFFRKVYQHKKFLQIANPLQSVKQFMGSGGHN